jgi:hypothetical protein
MKKLIAIFTLFQVIGISSVAAKESSIQSLAKIGYHSQSDNFRGTIDTDTTGFIGFLERQTSEDSFLSFFGMVGLLDEEWSASGVSIDAVDGYVVGFGLKFNLKGSDVKSFSQGLEHGMPYFRIGIERTKATLSSTIVQAAANNGIPLNSTSSTDSGIFFGIGYEKYFEEFGVFAEYMKHSEDTFDDNSINLGAFFKF